jgi:hypothetical protein
MVILILLNNTGAVSRESVVINLPKIYYVTLCYVMLRSIMHAQPKLFSSYCLSLKAKESVGKAVIFFYILQRTAFTKVA